MANMPDWVQLKKQMEVECLAQTDLELELEEVHRKLWVSVGYHHLVLEDVIQLL